MAKPPGIWYKGACQILALGDTLGTELWPFLFPIAQNVGPCTRLPLLRAQMHIHSYIYIYIYYHSWNHVNKVTVSQHHTPLDFSKPRILIRIGHAKTSGDMVARCMPNSGPGGSPGTWVMTIVASYVEPSFIFLILDISKYMVVYEGIWRYVEVI